MYGSINSGFVFLISIFRTRKCSASCAAKLDKIRARVRSFIDEARTQRHSPFQKVAAPARRRIRATFLRLNFVGSSARAGCVLPPAAINGAISITGCNSGNAIASHFSVRASPVSAANRIGCNALIMEDLSFNTCRASENTGVSPAPRMHSSDSIRTRASRMASFTSRSSSAEHLQSGALVSGRLN